MTSRPSGPSYAFDALGPWATRVDRDRDGIEIYMVDRYGYTTRPRVAFVSFAALTSAMASGGSAAESLAKKAILAAGYRMDGTELPGHVERYVPPESNHRPEQG